VTSNRSPQYLKQILRSDQKPKPSETTSVYLAGSITLDSLVPYIGGHLLLDGVSANIEVGPYNQILQFCNQPETYIDLGDPPDAICLIWRIEDLFPTALDRVLVEGRVSDELRSELDNFIDALSRLLKRYSGIIIVTTPPYPQRPGFSTEEVGQGQLGGNIYQNISAYWLQQIASLPQIQSLDLQALILQHGIASAHDARKWYMYRQPYREIFLAEIAWMISRIILAQKRSPRKCIVLDCDNTLWGGIVGEDGISGIQLGEDFPGRAYRDFQSFLKHLYHRGILLAIASKNNADDVFEVFDNHDAMVLKRENIACFEIGWDSKVESLKRIAGALNIGTDSLVFVDDNKKEVAEVMLRLPEVACLLVPEEIAFLPEFMGATGLFDQMQLTEEDRNRSRMIQAEQKREAKKSSLTEEEFKSSLDLQVSVFEVEPQHIARVTQLVNKTNQFNLTTIRRTQSEIEELARSAEYRVFAAEVKDKYGEYGLVGVAILAQSEKGAWLIDTLLLSCRVLGRDVETAFISALADVVLQIGGSELIGRFIPTSKNLQAESFYTRHGFQYNTSSGAWRAEAALVRTLMQGLTCKLSLHVRQGSESNIESY
jgi:FkbH-like protein